MSKITKTAGVVIFKDNLVLLVSHTKKAKHKTGVYGIPAGRLDPGENEIETAIRETYDETCLKVKKEILLPLPNLYKAVIERKNEPTRLFSLQAYLCLSYEGDPKNTEENIPKWVKVDNLDKYNLLPNIKQVILDALELSSNL